MTDLETSISFFRECLALQHPNRLPTLNNLAVALNIRFDQAGQREDLDSAISFHREALELRAAHHPDRSGSLNSLGDALSTQFHQTGQRENLDLAILCHRETLSLQSINLRLKRLKMLK